MEPATLSIERMDVVLAGRLAVAGLDLQVPSGAVYALLGGNGAGKTTTLNALLGFVQPATGRVRVCGIAPAQDAAAVRRLLAYVPENVALYPYMSGVENLRHFCALAGRRVDGARAEALLAQAGLQEGWWQQPTSRYSKGMRQKVGLAIAYAKAARAMLLDEPTSGLDPAAAADLAGRIRAAARAGMAVLMATHDLANTLQVADTIGILRAGRLVDEFAAAGLTHAALERRYLEHAAHGTEAP